METITLEQMYYIGEIIAAIAVIASLIYVGKQLRQNTSQMRVNAATIYSQWADGVYSRVASDREFAEVWQKGKSDFNSLDEVDKLRILNFNMGVLYMWSHFFQMHQLKTLPDYFWKSQLWAYENFGRRQDRQETWKILKEGFDKPFQDFMSQYIE